MHIASEHDRDKVKQYFKQALAVNRTIDEAKLELKDILDVLNEQHEIKPSIARKVIKAMEKGDMPEQRHQFELFDDLYKVTVGV